MDAQIAGLIGQEAGRAVRSCLSMPDRVVRVAEGMWLALSLPSSRQGESSLI